jgi:citrate lyase synthetase
MQEDIVMGVMIVEYVNTAHRVDTFIVAIGASASYLLRCLCASLARRTIGIFLAGG